MNNSVKDIYTEVLERIVKKLTATKPNVIFVLVGIDPYVHMDKFQEHITDVATFNKEGNMATLYSPAWFSGILQKLLTSTTYQILSHQQYASINEYLATDLFNGRIAAVYDNLRTLYPLSKEDYLERSDANGSEQRAEDMPCYHAEQLKIGDAYYYSLRWFDDSIAKKPFFTESRELTPKQGASDVIDVIDVISDPYALDIIINNCAREGDFGKVVYIKLSEKNELSRATTRTLKEANALLSRFGGGIYIHSEEAIKEEYVPREETLALLKQCWGENAKFRDIMVYENPDMGNKIIPVSQGRLVDTIIDEYENGRNGTLPRDVFITAPTGAGKSLIFQLPAFYASERGDVTIVVSPLKALMTDQVNILHQLRKYNKVEFLNSDLTLIDREKIIEGCKRGDVDILYLSPELLLSYDIHYFVGERKLGMLIIDEAHLITTWGRDFRVDYWFLGNYIYKMRKYNNYMFPLVALTATAVYGGGNDMVFDSISSLNMHDPHRFIGNVRRDNIEFVFDTHDDYPSGAYDNNKEDETVNIIKGLHELGIKSIVYAPYRRHIDRLKIKCDEIDSQMAVGYYGEMSQDAKDYSYRSFKNNTCKIMIATKAFGMGVDIPDIQAVYHHAPSGLLPDYVQEIGRAARKSEIQGFAALTFSQSDLRYSKQLFGMSSLKQYQLTEVLRKVIRYFHNNGNKRNMLMSTSDFAYIFDSANDVDQKVSTALMMIEKDYLAKTRFNVLIARPKKLFTRVYARVTPVSLAHLQQKYGRCYNEVYVKNDFHYIELNLDKIWSQHFSDKSFPQIKSEFYRQRFLINEGIELVPQVKVTISIDKPFQETLEALFHVFDALNQAFSHFKYKGEFFEQKEFKELLAVLLRKEFNAEKISAFVLGTYSSQVNSDSMMPEGDAFLQQRTRGHVTQYRVINNNYAAKLAQLKNIFSKLFDGKDEKSANRYLSINDIPLKNHTRLGSLLELIDYGTFESIGGDDPKIFLRLNDPRRVEKDANSGSYSNSILASVKNRHKFSCELFEYFFTHDFSNEKRWDMIEDFFLGMSNDDLFEKYPGGVQNHMDIVGYLRDNHNYTPSSEGDSQTYDTHNADLFKPRENEFYRSDSILAIGHQVKSIRKWITDDPVSLHRIMMRYSIAIDNEDFKVLVSKLQNNHFAYYRDFMRLKLRIEFPGYDGSVQASVPYNNDPVKFYRWWKQHKNDVTLNHAEKIQLFLKVDTINPRALNKAHKALINK